MNKAKRTKAIGALRKAGMSAENAVRHLRYLDLDTPLGPQIEELREDFPTLFDATAPDEPEDKPDTERPMTAREALAARLKGGSEHIQRKAFRRPAQPRPTTASKAAQEVAAHLTKNTTRNLPPVQKWREPVRELNDGHASPNRERPSSADAIANRLRGN